MKFSIIINHKKGGGGRNCSSASILTKESQKLANISQLTLHVNIDGIPLFNNSKTALWPILGCVVELNALVFPIALFCSNKKPTPLKNI